MEDSGKRGPREEVEVVRSIGRRDTLSFQMRGKKRVREVLNIENET